MPACWLTLVTGSRKDLLHTRVRARVAAGRKLVAAFVTRQDVEVAVRRGIVSWGTLKDDVPAGKGERSKTEDKQGKQL